MKKHTPLIVGNWKMNPEKVEKAELLFKEVKKAVAKMTGSEIVIAAPVIYITSLKKIAQKTKIALGTQNVHYELSGPFTGETSISMVKNQGVTHVILGHSERRKLGETDELINKKIKSVLGAGLTAVVCIGETSRDTQGTYFNEVESQMRAVLAGIEVQKLSRLVITYEPVWAVGTHMSASPEDVQEMKLFIQKCLTHQFDRSHVGKVRIIYGGSVTAETAGALIATGDVDGFLVGGASLKPKEFAGIISAAHTVRYDTTKSKKN